MFPAASDVWWYNRASATSEWNPPLLKYAHNIVNEGIGSLLWWLCPSKTILVQDDSQNEMSHAREHSPSTASPYLRLFIPPRLKIGIMSVLSEALPLQFLCTTRQPITSLRLRGHLAAVDRREQLSTGPCRGGVSQTPHPKHLWRLIHCSSGLRSPRTACNCHRDQYALG